MSGCRVAARAFVGMHDFGSFAPVADRSDEESSTRRAARAARVRRRRFALILIGVEGSHFLLEDVRRTVGAARGIVTRHGSTCRSATLNGLRVFSESASRYSACRRMVRSSA